MSQAFGSYATAGVDPNQYGTEVEQLVYQYGNYQPFGHAGMDIGCPVGTPVRAIADGTVLWADWGTNLPGDESWGPNGYFRRWALYKTFPGIVTVVQHDGWIGVYAHLSDAPLNPGDRVTEGQQIALSGNTRAPGVGLAAHLHVEALVDLTYSTGNGLIYGRTNPEPFFGSAAVSAQGSITPLEDFLMALSDAEQRALYNNIDYIASAKFKADVFAGTTDVERAARRQFNADLLNTPIPNVKGGSTTPAIELGWLPQNFANLPANVLNQSFKLADGTVTNLAGILTAINAKPVSGAAAGPVSTDVQAVANAVASTLADKLGK